MSWRVNLSGVTEEQQLVLCSKDGMVLRRIPWSRPGWRLGHQWWGLGLLSALHLVPVGLVHCGSRAHPQEVQEQQASA